MKYLHRVVFGIRERTAGVVPDLLIMGLDASDAEDVIARLAEGLQEAGAVDERYAADVIERERAFPTALPFEDFGFAMPHAQAEHVLRDAVAFARLSRSVPFRSMAMDGSVVDVEFVMLLAARDAQQHLRLLQDMLAALQDPAVRERLKAAQTESDMLAMLAGMCPVASNA